MEALKVWSSRPLRHFFHLASSSPLLPTSKSSTFIRCCSSSSSAAGAATTAGAVPKQGGRGRRSPAAPNTTSTYDRDAIRAIRLKKVGELRSKGFEPYAYKWDRTHTANQLQEIYKHLENGEESNSENDQVSISGIVARRAFGKLAFLTLRDDSGTIQLYCEKERLENDQFEQLKSLVDIGDILGVSGSIKRTEKGELSVCVSSFLILTKSLLPLPDKFHGLTDVDKRYRQRYVDMIANPEVADVFRKRAKGAAGGAEARPFITTITLSVGGFEKVYEIGRIFRNEGISTRHNPEFTTIEIYEAYSDYESMMNMAEEIVTQCALAVNGKLTVDYQGVEINLERPWRRETMHNLVKEATGIDFIELGNDLDAVKEATYNALNMGPNNQDRHLIEACSSVGHVLNEVNFNNLFQDLIHIL